MKLKYNFDLIKEWYDRIDVKFEIIKQLHNRELALLIPSWVKEKEVLITSTRMLRCHNLNHYDFVLKDLRFIERRLPYNFYYSLAQYIYGIPYQNFNDMANRKLVNEEWTKTHLQELEKFDFLLDIDAGDFSEIDSAFESANKVVLRLINLETPFEIRFSGKGFHVVIDEEHFLKNKFYNSLPREHKLMFYSQIAKYFYNTCSEMIDTTIYDFRRVCKLPYSLALYENSVLVCYPFRDYYEFKNFNLDKFRLKDFNIQIKQRGLFELNKFGNVDKLVKRVVDNGKKGI